MRYFQLEIGWNKFLFTTPQAAANVLTQLLDVPCVDTLWSDKGTIYYNKEPAPTITMVEIGAILPSYDAAVLKRDGQPAEEPAVEAKHVE